MAEPRRPGKATTLIRVERHELLYEGSAALPAIGLAALVAEGQLPRSLTALLRSGATEA